KVLSSSRWCPGAPPTAADPRPVLRAAGGRGPPLPPPLHAADRRAAGWLLAKPLLARRSARALRTRTARTADGNGVGRRAGPRSQLSQPHLARLQRARVHHQDAIAERPAAKPFVADGERPDGVLARRPAFAHP